MQRQRGRSLEIIGGAKDSKEQAQAVPPAIEDIYEEIAPVVFARCRSIVGDEATARDLTQEVLVTAEKKRGQLEDPAAFRRWIYRIATNRSLNELRRRSRDRVGLCDSADSVTLESAVGDDPRGTLEQRSLLTRVMQRLTERFGERKVNLLVRFHYNEQTQKEIGRDMGISERAVRKALAKLHDQLQVELSDLRAEFLAA